MIKVTLEFNNVEEAIVGLGRLAAVGKVRRAAAESAPSAAPSTTRIAGQDAIPADAEPTEIPKRERKPRADKGHKRGAHAARELEAEREGAVAQADTPDGATVGLPAAPSPEASAPTTAAPAAAPKDPPAKAGPVAAVSAEDAQAALEKVFAAKGLVVARDVLARFGVERLRDLLAEQRADFVARCSGVLEGEPA